MLQIPQSTTIDRSLHSVGSFHVAASCGGNFAKAVLDETLMHVQGTPPWVDQTSIFTLPSKPRQPVQHDNMRFTTLETVH